MEKNRIAAPFKIALIGGSAGSLDVLMKVLPHLGAIPSLVLVIVLHRKSAEDSTLEELIAMKTQVPVKDVEDKTPLLPGCIYVAPSDYHLLFEKNGTLSLDISEKVNHSRPSIDVSYESAADVYGPNLAGILLSGSNSDGTKGLMAIKKMDGIVAIQSPETAEMPYMPKYALDHVEVDFVLDPNELATFLINMGA